MIPIQVVYARNPNDLTLLELNVEDGCLVMDAITKSGILDQYPDIDLTQTTVGILGKAVPIDQALKAFDRVEIYRPLQADPKEARRRRAEKNKRTKPG